MLIKSEGKVVFLFGWGQSPTEDSCSVHCCNLLLVAFRVKKFLPLTLQWINMLEISMKKVWTTYPHTNNSTLRKHPYEIRVLQKYLIDKYSSILIVCITSVLSHCLFLSSSSGRLFNKVSNYFYLKIILRCHFVRNIRVSMYKIREE